MTKTSSSSSGTNTSSIAEHVQQSSQPKRNIHKIVRGELARVVGVARANEINLEDFWRALIREASVNFRKPIFGEVGKIGEEEQEAIEKEQKTRKKAWTEGVKEVIHRVFPNMRGDWNEKCKGCTRYCIPESMDKLGDLPRDENGVFVHPETGCGACRYCLINHVDHDGGLDGPTDFFWRNPLYGFSYPNKKAERGFSPQPSPLRLSDYGYSPCTLVQEGYTPSSPIQYGEAP